MRNNRARRGLGICLRPKHLKLVHEAPTDWRGRAPSPRSRPCKSTRAATSTLHPFSYLQPDEPPKELSEMFGILLFQIERADQLNGRHLFRARSRGFNHLLKRFFKRLVRVNGQQRDRLIGEGDPVLGRWKRASILA